MIKISYQNQTLEIEPMSLGVLLKQLNLEKVIAGKVNDQLVDLSYKLERNATVSFVTANDSEGLEILRHSTAHLLAHAIKQLFPEALPVIGPVIEDGFYYDFFYPKGFSESDLPLIEAKMKELAKANHRVERGVMAKNDAIKFFADLGEIYKVKLIEELPDHEVSLYKQGDFVDLCRGPHVGATGKIKAFKLTKLSGSYWRGDSKNEVLQRVYGTAFATPVELDDYLKRIELAKQRDHRLIAKKLDLFHIQEEAPGMIFWHPNGWTVYQEMRRYITERERVFGYQEVNTPIILERSLWEKSGHADKYAENMFLTASENHNFALKPMNCPGHVQIFKQGIKSYRDLPIRFSEFGCLHRNEASGTLHGLFRVRGFVQDDGHIFCTEEQIASEAYAYIEQLISTYAYFGFSDVSMRLSTRPPKRVGDDAVWDKAEQALIDVLNSRKIPWQLAPGDGAFYGPKIDFHLKDCLGRNWQCGTLQLDFSMPMRLDAYYITENGSKKHPVMLHRAMLGTIERFMGILLEETGGDLPLWLAPIQAVVLNITDEQREYVQRVTDLLKKSGFRANSDLRNEKISFKIREHSMRHVPYLLVIGNKEVESGAVAVRTRAGKDLGIMSIDSVLELLKNEK